MIDSNIDVMYNGGYVYRLVSVKEYTIGSSSVMMNRNDLKCCVKNNGWDDGSLTRLYVWVYDSDGFVVSVVEEDMFSDSLMKLCGVGDDSIVYRFVHVKDGVNGILNIYYEDEYGTLSWIGKEWIDDTILSLVWNLS